MLDLKPMELYGVLRKNPGVFVLDAAETRARYNAMHKVGHVLTRCISTGLLLQVCENHAKLHS
jgi:hypothetical protein